MSWTKDGPAAKFKEGDAVLYGVVGQRSVITVVEVGEYHSGYRDRFYLARFSNNTVSTVWESDIELAPVSKTSVGQGREQWLTQSLWRKYEKVIAANKPVERWLEKEKDKLTLTLRTITAAKDWVWGVVISVLSLLALLITAMITFPPPPGPHGEWPFVGWLFMASTIGGLVFWKKQGKVASVRTVALQEAKRKEQMQDPLWQRAELILKAVKEFKLLHDRYKAWQSAVYEGLQDGDATLTERYHAFLTRVSIGIDAGVSNFTRAAELTARQSEYRKKHPELAEEATSTHLSDLMAQLNCPVEIPAAITLMDPRSALEHEEALGEAVSQLYEGELIRQIDEALQNKKGEPLPSVSTEP